MRSTNTFFSTTISSPAGERRAWKIWRAVSGQPVQAKGWTMASMYATARIRSG